jgi:hypothetical protein
MKNVNTTGPVFRAGEAQLEILVHHFAGDSEWQPLNIKFGRQVLVDHYHPLVPEASAAGGKNSRKSAREEVRQTVGSQ